MKKLLFFLFLFSLNISVLFAIGSASNFVYYQNSIQSQNYEFTDDSIDYSGEYAYPISQINFNFPSGTNYTAMYPTYYTPTLFRGMITPIILPDFNSGKTYYSKYLKIESLIHPSTQTYIRSYRYNEEFNHYSMKYRYTIYAKSTTSVTIQYLNSHNGDYTEYRYQFSTNNFVVRLVNGTTITVGGVFLPSIIAFDCISVDVIQNYVYASYTETMHFTAYNFDGTIIAENSYNLGQFVDFNATKYDEVNFKYTGNTGIISEDINFYMGLQSNRIPLVRLTQLDYNKQEVFYLNNASNNECNEFNSSVLLNSGLYYTNELFWGRYLMYQTQSYNITGNNIFTSEINTMMKNSFSFNYQVELKSTSNHTLNMSFVDSNNIFRFKLNLEYKSNPNIVTLNFYNESTLIDSYSKSFYENYSVGHVVIQFKNNLLSTSIKNRFEVIEYSKFIPYYYANSSAINMLLGNYQLESLSNKQITQYSNGTNFGYKTTIYDEIHSIYLANDYYNLKNNLFEITDYKRYTNKINLQSFPKPNTIKDKNGNNLYLISNKIDKVLVNFSRNIDDCYISMVGIDNRNYYVFAINDGNLNFTVDMIIYGYSGGGYISFLTIYDTLSENLLLSVDITYLVTTIYSTENPNENLLTVLATQILVPFCIFGVIVFGFKSNSNSKYLGFIGMFVGIFALYLLDYMSIMFLIISSIILGIGLYFIIKSEKGDNI